MDIMMSLEASSLAALNEDFDEDPDGLEIEHYLSVFLRRLPKEKIGETLDEKIMLVKDLIELFEQVDVNGDGSMEWDEFTGYCIDSGMAATKHKTLVLSELYAETKYKDRDLHGPLITNLTFLKEVEKIALIGSNKKYVEIYEALSMPGPKRLHIIESKSTLAAGRDEIEAGAVLAVEYIPGMNLVVMATSDFAISFFQERYARSAKSVPFFRKRVHTSHAQSILRFCDWHDVNVLFSCGGRLPVINGWKVYLKGSEIRCDNVYQLKKHTDIITDICVSRGFGIDEDFCVLVTTSMDTTLNVWDMYNMNDPTRGPTKSLKKTMVGHKSGVLCLADCKDGRTVISCGFDYDALVWDVKALDVAPIIRLRGHRFPLRRCHFNNGRGITVDKQGWMKYWNLTTDLGAGQDRCLQTIHPKKKDWKPSATISLHPHKRLIFAAQKLMVFDTVRIRPKELPVCKIFYNDISMTVVGATGTTVKIWDAVTAEMIHEFHECMEYEISKMVLDDRKRKFICADIKGNIKCFNYLNGAMMKDVEPHTEQISDMIYSVEDRCIISVSWDRKLQILDEEPGEDDIPILRTVTDAHSNDISAAAFSHPLSLIATGDSQGVVKLWDFQFITCDSILQNTGIEITCMKFVDPYPILLVADFTAKVSVYGVRPLFGNKLIGTFTNQWKDKFDQTAIWPIITMELRFDPNGGQKIIDGGDNEDGTIYEGELTLICGDEGGNISILNLGRFLKDAGIEACNPDKLPINRNNYYARRIIEKEGDGMKKRKKKKNVDSDNEDDDKEANKNDKSLIVDTNVTPIKLKPLKGNFFPSPKAAKTGWKTTRKAKDNNKNHQKLLSLFSEESKINNGQQLQQTPQSESKQQQEQQSADKKQKNNNNRRLAALGQLKRSYSLPTIPVSPSPSSPNKKKQPQTVSKPTKLKRSNTRRFIDEMNSDKNKPRVMPKIHLIRRFEAHKTRIRSVSVSADPDIILTSADDFCVRLFNFSGEARGILTRGEEQDKKERNKIWLSPVDGNARELEKIDYATEMIDAVKEFEEEQQAEEDAEARKQREIEERRRRHEEAAAGEDEDSQILKEKLRAQDERDRLIDQLQGEKTWDLSDAEIGRIQAREDAQAKIDARKAKLMAKRSSEEADDAEMMELLSDPPPLDELKKLNMYSTGCGLTLEDENNWDIGGTNKQKLLYPKLYGEKHRVEVMEQEKMNKLRGPNLLAPSKWLLEQYSKHRSIIDQIELKQKRYRDGVEKTRRLLAKKKRQARLEAELRRRKKNKKVEIKMSKLDKVKEKVKLLAERNGLLPQCETPEQLHKRKESAKKLESLMSNFDLTIKAMHEDEESLALAKKREHRKLHRHKKHHRNHKEKMKLKRKKRLQKKREELEAAKNPKLSPEQKAAIEEKQRLKRLRLKKKLHFGTYGVKYVKNMRHVLKNLTKHSVDKDRVVVEDFLKLEKEGSALKDHYESMFKSIDIDANGEVDIRELIHMLFKKCNKNEQQDVEDYILMQASPRFVSDDKRELSYHEKQELEMLFKIWDDDESGELEADEIRRQITHDSGIEDHELDRIIKEADANGDGVIDKKEFVDMMRIIFDDNAHKSYQIEI